ncbi:MAG: hypothetical protein ABJE95_11100 [Byssovorax sp.]
MLAWLLLLGLTAFAAFAALGVTLRAAPEGRAEAGVVGTAVFITLISTPILALGYTNQLRPALIAIASLLTSTAAFLLSSRGRPPAAHARAIGHLATGLLRLPIDAFRLALQARSFVLLGLAGAALTIVVSTWLTYLAPSESWDGFFYHEPIVGFALQNRGFQMVPLPPSMVVQATNGYPRLCEALALWFVVFTDKTLIEIGNTLVLPGLMLSVYVIARRYSKDPVPLVGWSAALVLMPAVITQTRSSMIDVEVAFFLVAAIHFATRPVLRLRDAVSATLCMVLITGSKSSALTLVPPLLLVTWARLLLAHVRTRRGAALGVILGGGALIAGTGALTFARNWRAFGNPVWPVSFDSAALHVHWRGLATLARMTPDKPLAALVAQKYQRPSAGIADILARDYGHGIPWIVVPLALGSLVAAVVVAILARRAKKPDAVTENLLLVAALGAIFIKVSPSLSIARYNVQIVAVAMCCIGWAAGRLRDGTRFHEGAVASTLILTLVPLYWTGWFFGTDFKGVGALLHSSADERVTLHFADFQMPPDTAKARERELGPGDLVVFTQEMTFPGVLWNHRMSNRVEYVEFRAAPPFLAEIERRQPKWMVVGGASPARAALVAQPATWEFVGTACKQDQTVAFRRR